MSIHRTALIEDGVELGKDVRVGPFAVVERGARLGDGCSVGPHAVIHGCVTMGAGCTVHAGAVIGDTPQDLTFEKVASLVVVGSGCTFREGVTIHRGTKEGTSTTVGDNCYLMAFSHLAHNCVLGDRVILANAVLLGGYVEVGDGVFMGGHVGVHQFCKVGRLAMVGGAGSISQDIPPFCTSHSAALNTLAGLNVVGLRRAGLGPDERRELKAAYKKLFTGGLKMTEALVAVRAEFASAAVLELCAFIETSERGVCRPRSRER